MLKKELEKYSVHEKLITVINLLALLSTFLYWVYYKFMIDHTITSSHFKFRRYIFDNLIREIVILFIFLGVLHSLYYAVINKNFRLFIISICILIIQVILSGQLDISNGP